MWPNSLRGRILILMLIAVSLPVLAAGYFTTITAENALIAEKQQKLFGAARILDEYLDGNYDDILSKAGQLNGDRETKIRILNENLKGYTDKVAEAYPGIGVGYYSRELDAIITYGPSREYADKVGLPISATHEGRIVMETGIERVQEAKLVRGHIMNAMHPIIRNGTIIGYIWANELIEDIQAQKGAMKVHIYVIIVVGLVIATIGTAYLENRVLRDIDYIKTGLLRIRADLNQRLPPLAGELGEIASAINELVKNLAEKKKLEEQVHRTESLAAVGEMAAGLAHEIRNPLMAIRGFSQLISEGDLSEEQRGHVGIIIKETSRMNNLIEELLRLAKPVTNEAKRLNINMILENVLVLLEHKIRRGKIEIHRQFAQHIPDIMADYEQIKQAFLNIIINAIQAVDNNGVIKIITLYNCSTNNVQASIIDNGAGIEPENISRLFDPFFTTKANGTGLGLFVSQRLVQNWQGMIEVHSILGQGSTFIVTLPAAGENIE